MAKARALAKHCSLLFIISLPWHAHPHANLMDNNTKEKKKLTPACKHAGQQTSPSAMLTQGNRPVSGLARIARSPSHAIAQWLVDPL
jgi:hypothetical protein